MFSPEWKLALAIYLLTCPLAYIFATKVLHVPKQAALLAVLLFNAIPIANPPGAKTNLFIHDLVLPAVLFLVVTRADPRLKKFAFLPIIAIFVYPALSTLVGALLNDFERNAWMVFIFRRLAAVTFLLAGLFGVWRWASARGFFDTCVVIWIVLAICGILQANQLIDVDFRADTLDIGKVSILESKTAQRGFMGLNRGAVGLWGGCVLNYCLASCVLSMNFRTIRVLTYAVAVMLSLVVIFYAGSRTGMLACFVGTVYSLSRMIHLKAPVNAGRTMLLTFVGAVAVALFMVPAAEVILSRFEERGGVSSRSFQGRLVVQRKTVQHAFTDGRAAAIGMGGGFLELFPKTMRRIGRGKDRFVEAKHPHSEYLEVLWEAGILGLVLYLVMIYRFWKVIAYSSNSLSFVASGMFIVGVVAGLAVGNFMVTTDRLATYSCTFLFFYGLVIRELLLRGNTQSSQTAYSVRKYDRPCPVPQ